MRHLLTVLLFLSSSQVFSTNWFVRENGKVSGDGKTWETAFNANTLKKALETSEGSAFSSGDIIYFAGGTYRFDDVGSHYSINKGITFIGGLPTDLQGIDIPDVHYPSPTPTILSGDNNGDGVAGEGDSENLIVIRNCTENVTIRGFIFEYCHYTGTTDYNVGAVCVDYCNGTVHIDKCVFRHNISNHKGGALNNSGCKLMHVTDCSFDDNRSSKEGSAFRSSQRSMTVNGTKVYIVPNTVIERCVFSNNEILNASASDAKYGTIHMQHGKLWMINSTLTNNKAYSHSAGLSLKDATEAYVMSCTIAGNFCSRIYDNSSALPFSYGTAIYATKSAIVHLANSILLGTQDNDPVITRNTLYNGIDLPAVWPPSDMDKNSFEPMSVPYLNNVPRVIPINVGRQLFVDDFLIEKMEGVVRKFYKATKIEQNPIMKPQSVLETTSTPGAVTKDGGVWWEPRTQRFMMWYEAGWLKNMALATSRDGITWSRPNLRIGTQNQILPGYVPNSCAVVLDYDAPDDQRYKMFFRPPNDDADGMTGYLMTSADGYHWDNIIKSGQCGDRSTMFYNPFRKVWVFSLRNCGYLGNPPHGRCRFYHESNDFLSGADWNNSNTVFWSNADYLDLPDNTITPVTTPELYNLNAVGYESLMLGMHQIFLGPQNDICSSLGIPKITELKVSFSRDGFHWDRPFRDAFINASRTEDAWDRGYVQSVGGICSVVGNQLRFYYIGYGSGGMHYNGSTGIAVLRRDGFASITADESGTITTRPVIFDGKYLFVNVNSLAGSLSVEILDMNDQVIEGFSADKCIMVSVDSTIQQIEWSNHKSLESLIGKKVKFRFIMNHADLYAFWVSPSMKGESRGFVAGGGPGFTSNIDDQGIDAYNKASGFTKF